MMYFDIFFLILIIIINSGSFTAEEALFWTTEFDGYSHLLSSRGDPEAWVKALQTQTRISVQDNKSNSTSLSAGAIAADGTASGRVFAHDKLSGHIYSYALLPSVNIQKISSVTSKEVRDLTVDWVSHNLYITEYDTILILSYNTLLYQTLIDGLNEPWGIDVDPFERHIFWAEHSSGEIRRSDLTGQNLSTIRYHVGQPTLLVVDSAEQRVLWVNIFEDSVESCDYYGENWKILHRYDASGLAGIDIYQNYLFLAYKYVLQVDVKTKHNGSHVASIRLAKNVTQYGLSMSAKQPSIASLCLINNGGCDHICIHNTPRADCLCTVNHTLDSDGTTCLVDTNEVKNQEVQLQSLATVPPEDSSISVLDDATSSTSSSVFTTTALFLTTQASLAYKASLVMTILTAIFLVLILLGVILVIVIILKKKKTRMYAMTNQNKL